MSIKKMKDIDALRIRAYGVLVAKHGGHRMGYSRIEAPMLPGFPLIVQECMSCDTVLGFLCVPKEAADAMESSMRVPLMGAGIGDLSAPQPRRRLDSSCRFACTLCMDDNSCKTCPLCQRRSR